MNLFPFIHGGNIVRLNPGDFCIFDPRVPHAAEDITTDIKEIKNIVLRNCGNISELSIYRKGFTFISGAIIYIYRAVPTANKSNIIQKNIDIKILF